MMLSSIPEEPGTLVGMSPTVSQRWGGVEYSQIQPPADLFLGANSLGAAHLARLLKLLRSARLDTGSEMCSMWRMPCVSNHDLARRAPDAERCLPIVLFHRLRAGDAGRRLAWGDSG